MKKLIWLLFVLPLGEQIELYESTLPQIEVVSTIYNKTYSEELIKALEGYSEESYEDGLGYSICWGNKSFKNEKIDRKDCEKRFVSLHNKVWKKLKNKYPNLTTSQLAIYSSFYWNSWIGKELDKAIKNGEFCEIQNHYLRYVKYKGHPNSALLKRRCWELHYLEKTYL